jgi:dTDP-glucose 4,6-dehydratase
VDKAELGDLVLKLAPRLNALTGARILLTGATGWFGVWLLDALCEADDLLQLGITITAVSRSPARFAARFPAFAADSRITWLTADVRQLAIAPDFFTHVIHAATDSSVKSAPVSDLQLLETVVDGTARALAAIGPQCKSFLFLSSGAVYGPAQQDAKGFSEDQPESLVPESQLGVYAKAKRMAERLCAECANRGLPAKIARCFAFVGPHMPFEAHFAIGNFIADAVDGRLIHVKSDGRPLRSYLYMTDLVGALVAILVDGTMGRPYNVGSDVAVSVKELAHCVDRVIGGAGVRIDGVASDPADRYVPDITRLRSELNFCPQVPLELAIAKTADWRRANRGAVIL